MFGLEAASALVRALGTVGLVLLEAIVLYVAYGGVTRVAGGPVLDAVGGE